MADTDREFILAKLHEQTEYIVEKIEAVSQQGEAHQRENERRFLELEKARVEDQQARVAMQEMSGQVRELNASVRTLIDSDRHQNQDIGALSARVADVNRPAVRAEAASEGMVAGAAAGKSTSRFWGIVGVILATVVTSAMQYCEHQISVGAFEEPKK